MEIETTNDLLEDFKRTSRESVEFSKKCALLAQAILAGESTIVQFVERLGVLLVDKDPSNRELGVWILSRVLEGLPANFFDTKQLSFLCAFLADRLNDHHQVVPAVFRGVLALSKFDNFPAGESTRILSSLFQHVSCQQQQEKDRRVVFQIFRVFLDKHATEMLTMGFEYVMGVITAVDGERNPQNLIQLFNWYPQFLRTVALGHLSEEMFEVLACYFPVDFRTPSEDPLAITRENLADALATCLTAIPEFAEFCFPLALEKLDSSLEVAKLDSLKLLEVGCSTFDTDAYVRHSVEMWSQLQKELFNNPNGALEEACLRTLRAVIAKISQGPNFAGTVKDILDTVKRNLMPDYKLFEPSAKLLLSVAKACELSSELVTREIAPILANMFNIARTGSARVTILKTLVEFFCSYVQYHEAIEIDELASTPGLCLKCTLEDDERVKVAAFHSLSVITPFLSAGVRQALYQNFHHWLLAPKKEPIRTEILRCFRNLAEGYPAEVKNVIDAICVKDTASLELYLDSLSVVASISFFTPHLISKFMTYLTDPSSGQIVINSLQKVLQQDNSQSVICVLVEKNVATLLIDWCLVNQVSDEALSSLAFVLAAITGGQSSHWQQEFIDKEWPKINDLSNRRHLMLTFGLLCRLQQNVAVEYAILDDLTNIITGTDHFVQDKAAQLLANLVNKCNNEITLEDFLNRSLDGVNSTVSAWITKALVLRNHKAAAVWTDRMIENLKVDAGVAKGFRIILDDNFDALSCETHCTKALFYQQKFFTIVSNKLVESYKPELTSYLVALGYLLEHVPKQAVLVQFKKILRLIILCLDHCQEGEVLTVLLQLINDFMCNKEQCIEDHISDFLTRFLQLSAFDKSMKVRISALKCLQQCTDSIPVYKLLPHKFKVLQELARAIDDKKRIVRREAVEARSMWFLLDAPKD